MDYPRPDELRGKRLGRRKFLGAAGVAGAAGAGAIGAGMVGLPIGTESDPELEVRIHDLELRVDILEGLEPPPEPTLTPTAEPTATATAEPTTTATTVPTATATTVPTATATTAPTATATTAPTATATTAPTATPTITPTPGPPKVLPVGFVTELPRTNETATAKNWADLFDMCREGGVDVVIDGIHIPMQANLYLAADTHLRGLNGASISGYQVMLAQPRLAVENLTHSTPVGSGRDAFSNLPGADQVLLANLTIPENGDGAIDIWKANGRFTIYRCDISGNGRGMAVNGEHSGQTRVTIAECKLHADHRNPMVKSPPTYVHLVNSWLPRWSIYGLGMEDDARALVQANAFTYGGYHRARARRTQAGVTTRVSVCGS